MALLRDSSTDGTSDGSSDDSSNGDESDFSDGCPVMEATAVKVTDTQMAVRMAKGIAAATQANNGENQKGL